MLLGRIQCVGKAYAFNKVERQYRLVEHLDQAKGAFGSWSCQWTPLVLCTLDGPSLA